MANERIPEALRRADNTLQCPRCGVRVVGMGMVALAHNYLHCNTILEGLKRQPYDVPNPEPLTEA